MEGDFGVTPSVIDEFHRLYIKGVRMERERGVTRKIID